MTHHQLSKDVPDLQPANQGSNPNALTFGITDEQRLQRFLILGSSTSMFSALKMSDDELKFLRGSESADGMFLRHIVQTDGLNAIEAARKVSVEGLAKQNDWALILLAYALTYGSDTVKSKVKYVLPEVARTGSHLLMFCSLISELRSFGPAVRNTINRWYLTKSPESLAYTVAKYQRRNNWAHYDVFNVCHPRIPQGHPLESVSKWILKKELDTNTPRILYATDLIKTASPQEAQRLILDYHLSHEMVPNELKGNPEVWDALFETMGFTALLRNLAKMTQCGVIAPGSVREAQMIEKLLDEESLKRNRIHPIALLNAYKVYGSGGNLGQGRRSYEPCPDIVEALQMAFELSFTYGETTNQNLFFGIDVSGSMNTPISGSQVVSCREASAILALIAAKKNRGQNTFMGFSTGRIKSSSPIYFDFNEDDTFASVMEKISDLPFQGTDCSLPVMEAFRKRLEVDAFVVITDNDANEKSSLVLPPTNPGQESRVIETGAYGALQAYRQYVNRVTKFVVLSMMSNPYGLTPARSAKDKDPGVADFVGFSADTPAVLSDFLLDKL